MYIVDNLGWLAFAGDLESFQGNVIFADTAHKYRKIDVKKSQNIILDYNIHLSTPVIILRIFWP